MLPKPTKRQGSKQRPSESGSNKNCLTPSGEWHQLIIPSGEEPKEMLPLSVVMGKRIGQKVEERERWRKDKYTGKRY